MFVNIAHIDGCMCRWYLYAPTGTLETLILVLKNVQFFLYDCYINSIINVFVHIIF